MRYAIELTLDADGDGDLKAGHGCSAEIVVEQQALDAVLHHFNPTSDPRVEKIKVLSAGLIQVLRDYQRAEGTTPAQQRVAATAITEIVGTLHVAAVKSFFAK